MCSRDGQGSREAAGAAGASAGERQLRKRTHAGQAYQAVAVVRKCVCLVDERKMLTSSPPTLVATRFQVNFPLYHPTCSLFFKSRPSHTYIYIFKRASFARTALARTAPHTRTTSQLKGDEWPTSQFLYWAAQAELRSHSPALRPPLKPLRSPSVYSTRTRTGGALAFRSMATPLSERAGCAIVVLASPISWQGLRHTPHSLQLRPKARDAEHQI